MRDNKHYRHSDQIGYFSCIHYIIKESKVIYSVSTLYYRVTILMADITKGSGNVFEDLGFEPIEAADLKTRVGLMLKLREFIRSQHWTLAQAAAHFNESESRISHLMDGDIEYFTVKQLVHLLSVAGIDA